MKVFFLTIILLLSPKLWSSELRFDNVDDQIRAEEDPHFAEALIEQQKQIERERTFAEQQSKIRAQAEAEDEKNRLQFIEKRDRQLLVSREEQRKNYLKFLKTKQQERAQRSQEEEKYFSWREQEREKLLAKQKEQLALIKASFPACLPLP